MRRRGSRRCARKRCERGATDVRPRMTRIIYRPAFGCRLDRRAAGRCPASRLRGEAPMQVLAFQPSEVMVVRASSHRERCGQKPPERGELRLGSALEPGPRCTASRGHGCAQTACLTSVGHAESHTRSPRRVSRWQRSNSKGIASDPGQNRTRVVAGCIGRYTRVPPSDANTPRPLQEPSPSHRAIASGIGLAPDEGDAPLGNSRHLSIAMALLHE